MFYLIALKYERAVNVSWEGLHHFVRLWGPCGPACRTRPLLGRPCLAHRPGLDADLSAKGTSSAALCV